MSVQRLRSRGRVVVVLPMLVAACRGAHLYRQPEHQLAATAQTAFGEAKLAESLRGERAMLDSLLAQELAAVRRHSVARRDAILRAAIGGTSAAKSWTYLDSVAQARVKELVGTPDEARRLVGVATGLPERLDAMARRADVYRILRGSVDPEPTCPIGNAPSPESGAGVVFASYKAECEGYLMAEQQLRTFAAPGTAVGNINALLTAGEADYSALMKEIAALGRSYRTAKAAYDAAVKAADASAVRAAAERLKRELDGFDELAGRTRSFDGELGDLKLAAAAAGLERRQESLDRVLDVLLRSGPDDTGAPPDTTRSDLAVLAWLPALERQISATKYPDVKALLMERENIRLRLAAVRSRHANAEGRLALLRQKRDALVTELIWVNGAREMLAGAATAEPDGGGCDGRASLVGAYERGTVRCRERVVAGLLRYANAWTLGRIPQDEIDYRLIAARHAAIIDASENALAQWESLVQIPIDQLAAYHASGTTSQDVAAFLSALGLGAVAATAAK